MTLGGRSSTRVKDSAGGAVKRETVRSVERSDAAHAGPTRILWGGYRAIYRDSFLSRYGTGGDELLAGRRASCLGPGFEAGMCPRTSMAGAPFLGMEPVGNYAIHILVNRGTVTLAGMVDSQSDKDAAGIKANGVFGAFKVVNDLQIAPRKS